MNLKKLLYIALVGLGMTSLATASMSTMPLIRDNQKDITLVYADGTLGNNKIVVSGSLKAMWAQYTGGEMLAMAVKNAESPMERLMKIIANKEVGMWMGVETDTFNMVRKQHRVAPPVARKPGARPEGGSPARAEMPMMKRGLPQGLDYDDLDAIADAREDKAARRIQSAWRQNQMRKALIESERMRAQNAMTDYDRFGPEEGEEPKEVDLEAYHIAKMHWKKTHSQTKGWYGRMLRDLKKEGFAAEVALDREGRK